jgi:hypothetical protein
MESLLSRFTFVYAAAMLLFCFIQRITIPKLCYFSKLYYRTSLYVRIVSGASVDSTSHVRSSANLVLSIVGN